MLTRKSFPIVAVILFFQFSVATAAPTCRDPIWIRRLTAKIDSADPDTLQQAQQWLNRWINLSDETVARGMLRTLLTRDLEAIGVTFKNLRPGDMPFLPGAQLQQQTDEMYRVIGQLTGTDPDFTPMHGLVDHIKKIMSDNRTSQLGALLDLRAADEIGLAQSLGIAGGGFEVTETARSPLIPDDVVSRNMDIFDPATGFAHESKNWPSGLPRDLDGNVSEAILLKFEEEFRRDIVIFGTQTPRPFRGYRLNFREETRAHLDFLKARLDAQFSSSFVRARISAEQLNDIKRTFDGLWQAKDAGSLLRFFP